MTGFPLVCFLNKSQAVKQWECLNKILSMKTKTMWFERLCFSLQKMEDLHWCWAHVTSINSIICLSQVQYMNTYTSVWILGVCATKLLLTIQLFSRLPCLYSMVSTELLHCTALHWGQCWISSYFNLTIRFLVCQTCGLAVLQGTSFLMVYKSSKDSPNIHIRFKFFFFF